LIEINAQGDRSMQSAHVMRFIYRCPATGYRVEGLERTDVEPAARPLKTYVAERCPACTGLHIVNPQTGALLSDEAGLFTRSSAAGGPRGGRGRGSWAAGIACGP
jgi:hypothetical protein